MSDEFHLVVPQLTNRLLVTVGLLIVSVFNNMSIHCQVYTYLTPRYSQWIWCIPVHRSKNNAMDRLTQYAVKAPHEQSFGEEHMQVCRPRPQQWLAATTQWYRHHSDTINWSQSISTLFGNDLMEEIISAFLYSISKCIVRHRKLRTPYSVKSQFTDVWCATHRN